MNIKQIKDLVSVYDACRLYGFRTNNKGFMQCIFHNEKTASLKVYKGNKGYYCFGCGAGGDIIDFIQKAFNLSFMEAISKLNLDFNLNLDLRNANPQYKQTSVYIEAKKEQFKEDMRKRKLDKLYNKLCEIHRNMYMLQQKYKPKSPTEPLHPLYLQNSGFTYQHIKYTLERLYEDIYINKCYKDEQYSNEVFKSVIESL